MTRPQKESDMKREHRVTIRLTDTEFSIIETQNPAFSMLEWQRCRNAQEVNDISTPFSTPIYI